MYREPAPPAPDAPLPTELVCIGADRDQRSKAPLALLQVFAAPLMVGGVLAAIASPTVGLVGLLASAALAVWWWRRGRTSQGALLRIERGALLVLSRDARDERGRYALADLLNVTLDTKTIRPVQDGPSAIPAMRFIDSQVAPEVDTARVVLVSRGRADMPMSEKYLSHMDAMDWLGRIRVFLRKHGWVPQDERDDEGPPPSPSKSTPSPS